MKTTGVNSSRSCKHWKPGIVEKIESTEKSKGHFIEQIMIMIISNVWRNSSLSGWMSLLNLATK